MSSKYKELIIKTLKKDEIMSTNQIRDAIKKPAGVKYIEFNLVYRLLEQLEREGLAEKLKGSKKSFYWKRK
ncbi:MAG: hypothetical protein HZB65_04595 [Candidatus Aenigmarchaeota archaeon]|nr:hypothetical protein [Candidatus Aenigmarchaeota archaeon]